jgi:hypothetical protein
MESFTKPTIIPNYEQYILYRINNDDPYELYVNICIGLYFAGMRRVTKQTTQQAIEETKARYKYGDVFVFWPLLSMLHDDARWEQIYQIDLEYFTNRILKTVEPRDAIAAAGQQFSQLFNVQYAPIEFEIPKEQQYNFKNWPWYWGPWGWIWIHTSLSFTYDSTLNVPGQLVYYLPLLITCGICFEHWEKNKKQLMEFYTKKPLSAARQQILALQIIRFHNITRLQYNTTNLRAYDAQIQAVGTQSTSEQEANILLFYQNFARRIQESLR